MEEIGAIIAILGLIGIIVILGIGIFHTSVVGGLVYIFAIMIVIGGLMAGWDDKPWWY